MHKCNKVESKRENGITSEKVGELKECQTIFDFKSFICLYQPFNLNSFCQMHFLQVCLCVLKLQPLWLNVYVSSDRHVFSLFSLLLVVDLLPELAVVNKVN